MALSEGIDRDRAVDEAGKHIAVLGRIGARPFNLEEMERMYLLPGTGTTPGKRAPVPWMVVDPQRNLKLQSGREQEIDLHLQTEQFYGTSLLRK